MAKKSSLDSLALYQKVKNYDSKEKRKARINELIDGKKAEITKGLPALERKIAKTQAMIDSGKGTEKDQLKLSSLLIEKEELEARVNGSKSKKEFMQEEFTYDEKSEVNALIAYEKHPHQIEGIVKIIKGYENKINEEKAQEEAMREEIKSLKKEKAEAKATIEDIRKKSEVAENLADPVKADEMAKQNATLRARIPEIDAAIKELNAKLEPESEKNANSKTIHEYEMRIAVCVDALDHMLQGKSWDDITAQYGNEKPYEDPFKDEVEDDEPDMSEVRPVKPARHPLFRTPTAVRPTGPVVGTSVVKDEEDKDFDEDREDESDPSFVPPEEEEEEEEEPGFFKKLFGKIKALFKGDDLKKLDAGEDEIDDEEYDDYEDDEEYEDDYEDDRDHDGEKDDREGDDGPIIDPEMFKDVNETGKEPEKDDDSLDPFLKGMLKKDFLDEKDDEAKEDKDIKVKDEPADDAEFKKAYVMRLKENILVHEAKMISIHNSHIRDNDKSAPVKDDEKGEEK